MPHKLQNGDIRATIPGMYSTTTELVPEDRRVFLTRADAETHLAANRRHYHSRAFVDRRKVWRNPAMASLLAMLYALDLPSSLNSAETSSRRT